MNKTLKYFLIGLAIVAGIYAFADNSNNQLPASVYTISPTPYPTPYPTPEATLSNNNYYQNSYGNEVHSPAYDSTVPVGASAQCGDGTYSFSQHRSGTCSHHGGVSEWLY